MLGKVWAAIIQTMLQLYRQCVTGIGDIEVRSCFCASFSAETKESIADVELVVITRNLAWVPPPFVLNSVMGRVIGHPAGIRREKVPNLLLMIFV